MKIGIILNPHTQDKYLNVNKYSEWYNKLITNEDYKEFMNYDKNKKKFYPNADLAIYYYLKENYKKHTFDILTEDDISLKKFNEYDYIWGSYDPHYYYNEYDNDKYYYNRYMNIIKKTSANYYQQPDILNFIINKKNYYEFLKKNNFPVYPSLYYNLNTHNKRECNSIYEKIIKQGWKKIIIKPEFAGGGGGSTYICDVTKNDVKKTLNSLYDENYPRVIIQKFNKDFANFYELKTYWYNNKYQYSVGLIINPNSLGKYFDTLQYDYPENEGGTIEMKLVNKLKKMGKEILEKIPYDTRFLTRIDFACCLVNKKMCRDYYVNEIEQNPNILPDDTKFPVIEKFSKHIMKNIFI